MAEYQRLDEACHINMGQSPDSKSYNQEGVGLPFFQGNADFGAVHPETRVWCSSPTKIVEAGTLLISVRAPIGALNFAKERSCIGRGLAGITPQNGVSLKYIYYCLKGKNKELNAKGTGSTFKAIAKSALGETPVKIVSEEDQLKIIQTLDRVSSVIEARKQQLTELDNLIKARFVELFGNPVINNKGWNVSDLGQLTIKIGSGATPKGGKEAYQTDGISLIRSMNVHNGKFEYKELAHISDEQAARLENVAVEENDVLLNITGASVARSCVVPTNVLPARVNQHVCIIRCKDSIMPDFINSLLIDDNYQDLLWSIAGSGATREAITKQQVESLQIILPPISKQEEFSKFINRVDKSKLLQFFCFPI